jgi:hypothetical protein
MGRAIYTWDPSEPNDPGPLIDVSVMNSYEVLEAWRREGLECPLPVTMKQGNRMKVSVI